MNEHMKQDQRRSAENANYFYHIILKQKSLLTRAADALEPEQNPVDPYRKDICPEHVSLIQELREAAK